MRELRSWLLEMPILPARMDHKPRRGGGVYEPRAPPGLGPLEPSKEHYDRDDVVRAIVAANAGPALAMAFGVKFRELTTNGAGFMRCHAISRAKPGRETDDVRPSATFDPRTLVYMEFYTQPPEGISLFDLGVLWGRYATWMECCNALGKEFGCKPKRWE